MKAMFNSLLAAVVAVTLICGCEGGGSGGSDPTVDVTGTWKGTMTFANETDSGTLQLTQDGSSVSGTDGESSYSGTVSGKTLNLTSSLTEGADTMTLEVSGDVEGDSMVLSGTVSGTVDGVNLEAPITFDLRR